MVTPAETSLRAFSAMRSSRWASLSALRRVTGSTWGVEAQVHVRVDQSWQDGVSRQVEHLACLSGAAAWPHGDDAGPVDEDLAVLDHLSWTSGEHLRRPNDPHASQRATGLKAARRGS
ncbi:hypothetical protein GCM10020001_064630 [Nonomuraea salmonea]